MTMTFNKMCNIILEGKGKSAKYANLVVGNENPVFTAEDILKDPSDPSKGTKLYLPQRYIKQDGLAPDDPQSIRRQLRAVNWLARNLIRKAKRKKDGISLDSFTKDAIDLMGAYQTKVMGREKPDKANTGYDARIIGNLLLPPTPGNPNGKSVFVVPGMDPNAPAPTASVRSSSKGSKGPKGTKKAKAPVLDIQLTPEELDQRINQAWQLAELYFDSDLQDIIFKHAEQGNQIKDILEDDEVKDVYDKNDVRTVVRSLLKTGKLDRDFETGGLKLNTGFSDDLQNLAKHRPGITGAEDYLGDEESIPTAAEDEETVGTIETPIDSPEDNIEDEENTDIHIPDRPSWESGRDDMLDGDEEDDEVASPDSDEEDDQWWKV